MRGRTDSLAHQHQLMPAMSLSPQLLVTREDEPTTEMVFLVLPSVPSLVGSKGDEMSRLRSKAHTCDQVLDLSKGACVLWEPTGLGPGRREAACAPDGGSLWPGAGGEGDTKRQPSLPAWRLLGASPQNLWGLQGQPHLHPRGKQPILPPWGMQLLWVPAASAQHKGHCHTDLKEDMTGGPRDAHRKQQGCSGPLRRSQHSRGWSTGACFPERQVRILHMALAATACTCQDCVRKATPLRLLGTTDDTEASPQRGQRQAGAPRHQEESRHTTATA